MKAKKTYELTPGVKKQEMSQTEKRNNLERLFLLAEYRLIMISKNYARKLKFKEHEEFARDIVQEAYFKMLNNMDSLYHNFHNTEATEEKKFIAWARKIMWNAGLDIIRKDKNNPLPFGHSKKNVDSSIIENFSDGQTEELTEAQCELLRQLEEEAIEKELSKSEKFMYRETRDYGMPKEIPDHIINEILDHCGKKSIKTLKSEIRRSKRDVYNYMKKKIHLIHKI